MKKQLELAKDKTVFVTLHFPPLEPFSSKSHQIVEPDVTKLMTVLEGAPNVAAVFTGHYHSARIKTQNGIHYFSAPASGARAKIRTGANWLTVPINYAATTFSSTCSSPRCCWLSQPTMSA